MEFLMKFYGSSPLEVLGVPTFNQEVATRTFYSLVD